MARTATVHVESEACRCGCGQPAIPGLADDAVLLAIGKRHADELEVKSRSGGRRREEAEKLLWAWDRCAEALDAHVHGRPVGMLGPPTPAWMACWADRVKAL